MLKAGFLTTRLSSRMANFEKYSYMGAKPLSSISVAAFKSSFSCNSFTQRGGNALGWITAIVQVGRGSMGVGR